MGRIWLNFRFFYQMYPVPCGIAKMGELSTGLSQETRRFEAERVFRTRARGSAELSEQTAPRFNGGILLGSDLLEATKRQGETVVSSCGGGRTRRKRGDSISRS